MESSEYLGGQWLPLVSLSDDGSATNKLVHKSLDDQQRERLKEEHRRVPNVRGKAPRGTQQWLASMPARLRHLRGAQKLLCKAVVVVHDGGALPALALELCRSIDALAGTMIMPANQMKIAREVIERVSTRDMLRMTNYEDHDVTTTVLALYVETVVRDLLTLLKEVTAFKSELGGDGSKSAAMRDLLRDILGFEAELEAFGLLLHCTARVALPACGARYGANALDGFGTTALRVPQAVGSARRARGAPPLSQLQPALLADDATPMDDDDVPCDDDVREPLVMWSRHEPRLQQPLPSHHSAARATASVDGMQRLDIQTTSLRPPRVRRRGKCNGKLRPPRVRRRGRKTPAAACSATVSVTENSGRRVFGNGKPLLVMKRSNLVSHDLR